MTTDKSLFLITKRKIIEAFGSGLAPASDTGPAGCRAVFAAPVRGSRGPGPECEILVGGGRPGGSAVRVLGGLAIDL